MEDPSNSQLSVWLKCKLCGGIFSKLSKFILHKQQWHLEEFQRTNTHCIVFEEVISIGNQQFNDELLAGRTHVNTATENCQLHQHQELKGGFPGSVSVPIPAADDIPSKIPQLALDPVHKNLEHEEIVTDQKLFKTGFPKVQIMRLTSQQIEAAINKLKNKNLSQNTDSQEESTDSTTIKQEPDYNGAHSHNSSVDTGLRPYKCRQDGCTKEFKQRHHYKKHSEVHKEIRSSFTCSICNTKVLWKASLSRHYFLVHSPAAKLHKCSHAECTKLFKTRSGLKRHNNEFHVNNGDGVDRPVPVFACQICQTIYRRKYQLKRHNLGQSHSRKLLGKF